MPTILLILYFGPRYEKPVYQPVKSEDPDPEQTDGKSYHPSHRTSIPHRKAKLYLCGLCLSCYATARIGYFNFSSALFQNLTIRLSATTSAHLLSILSSSYTLGRLTSALISIKVHPDTIVSYHLAILLGAISALFWGRDDLWWITVATAFLGKHSGSGFGFKVSS